MLIFGRTISFLSLAVYHSSRWELAAIAHLGSWFIQVRRRHAERCRWEKLIRITLMFDERRKTGDYGENEWGPLIMQKEYKMKRQSSIGCTHMDQIWRMCPCLKDSCRERKKQDQYNSDSMIKRYQWHTDIWSFTEEAFWQFH